MSSPTQTRPVVTLYPSTQDDANAYMAAIRLARSVRNSMDAQKAGVEAEKSAVKADSHGPHQPNLPPPPLVNSTTPGGREPVPVLNQTASAQSASNATKPGFVNPRDRYPSSSRSDSIGTWPQRASAPAADLFTLANTPTGPTSEALKPHQGYFPPPDPPKSTGDGPNLGDIAADTPAGVKLHVSPPIGATPAPPGEPISRRTGPIPIHPKAGPIDIGLYIPGNIPPQCQLYVTNTGINNTFAVCPVTKRATKPISNLASREFHIGDALSPRILAIRDTAVCEAPTSFNQRLVCGQLDGWFALAFFLLFCTICAAWITRRKYNGRQLDEENGTATWPRRSYVSTGGSEAKPKLRTSRVSTNIAEAKLRGKIRKAHEKNRHLDGEPSTKQYESMAWRSASHRAARANVGGTFGHDAGPVAVLPKLSAEVPAHHSFEPLAS